LHPAALTKVEPERQYSGIGINEPEKLGGIMLKIHAKKLDAVKVLSLEGQIINGDTELLRKVVQSIAGTTDVILDFSNVTIVDAHGLGVLLQLREQCLAQGIRFKVINVSKPLSRIFEITRLNTVFEINSSVEILPHRALPVAA